MSTKPRTREHFPRMKERGGRRRHGKRAPRDPFAAMVEFAKALGVAFETMQQAWLEAFLGQPVGTKSDYTLASGRRG